MQCGEGGREGEGVMGKGVCVCTLSASLLHVKVNCKKSSRQL